MNLESRACKILGKKTYLAIAKRHNLTTKKWTIGRLKGFREDIDFYIKNKLSKKNKKVKVGK